MFRLFRRQTWPEGAEPLPTLSPSERLQAVIRERIAMIPIEDGHETAPLASVAKIAAAAVAEVQRSLLEDARLHNRSTLKAIQAAFRRVYRA